MKFTKFLITLLFLSFTNLKANLAYVTNEKDNTVSVIDTKRKKLSKQLKWDRGPEG